MTPPDTNKARYRHDGGSLDFLSHKRNCLNVRNYGMQPRGHRFSQQVLGSSGW